VLVPQVTCLLLLLVMLFPPCNLKAQRIQATGFVGGTLLGGGTKGLEIRVGTDNADWNVNGGLSIQWTKSVVQHLREPSEAIYFTEGIPYLEGSAYRIAGIGLSAWTARGRRLAWRPRGFLTLSLPVKLWRNIDFVPSLQMMTSLQVLTVPQVFLGAGISISI
jgi:hypothetical protein